jgi:hypothetical protein
LKTEKSRALYTVFAVLLAFCSWAGLAYADSAADYYEFCVAKRACGLVNSKGEVVVEPRFGAIRVNDGENIAFIVKSGAFGARPKFGMVNFEDGLVVVEPQFDYMGRLGEGLIIVGLAGKYGYINTKGEVVIKPQFSSASDYFKNGFSVVAIDEKIGKENKRKYGFIDTKGEWFLEPQFEFADGFEEDGFASARINGKWGLIDKSGKFVIEPKFDSSSTVRHEVRTLRQGDTVVYINSEGNYVAEAETESRFRSGLRSVQVDWKWGYINTEGEMAIAPQFDAVLEFHEEGFAFASKDGAAYLINAKGEVLLTADFWLEAGKVADKGFIRFEKDKKWGLADYSGKVLAKPQYENMLVFENGLLRVVKNGKYGYLDEHGNEVIDFQFDRIDHFLDSGLAVAFKERKAGLINAEGEWVIEPQYENMVESSGREQRKKDILWAKKNGVTYYLNTQGEVLLYMDNVCDTDVARNAKGEIIYPRDFSENCAQTRSGISE